jgi:hypothetical protein
LRMLLKRSGIQNIGSCGSPIAHALEIAHEQARNIVTG